MNDRIKYPTVLLHLIELVNILSGSPSTSPSESPLDSVTMKPTEEPTSDPVHAPTVHPTANPSEQPTHPTNMPTSNPTNNPISDPTMNPTDVPTTAPSSAPSVDPTAHPTPSPQCTWSWTVSKKNDKHKVSGVYQKDSEITSDTHIVEIWKRSSGIVPAYLWHLLWFAPINGNIQNIIGFGNPHWQTSDVRNHVALWTPTMTQICLGQEILSILRCVNGYCLWYEPNPGPTHANVTQCTRGWRKCGNRPKITSKYECV